MIVKVIFTNIITLIECLKFFSIFLSVILKHCLLDIHLQHSFSFIFASKRIFVNLLNSWVLTKLVDLIKQNLFLIYVAYFYVVMWSPTFKLGSSSLFPTPCLIYVLGLTWCWLHFSCFLKIATVFHPVCQYTHFWYCSHILINFTRQGSDKSASNDKFSFVVFWIIM